MPPCVRAIPYTPSLKLATSPEPLGSKKGTVRASREGEELAVPPTYRPLILSVKATRGHPANLCAPFIGLRIQSLKENQAPLPAN